MRYFKKIIDALGEYEDAAGVRYSIAVVRRIRTTAGVNVGYEPFDTLSQALAVWRLTHNEKHTI